METKNTAENVGTGTTDGSAAIGLDNEKIVRSWSTNHYCVRAADSIAETIKKKCGLSCDRSKLLNVLVEIADDAKSNLDVSNVRSVDSLKHALIQAIKKAKI